MKYYSTKIDRLGKGHIATLTEKRIREAKYEKMQKKPSPQTWSARMLAYCHTELCVVWGLRRYPASEADEAIS